MQKFYWFSIAYAEGKNPYRDVFSRASNRPKRLSASLYVECSEDEAQRAVLEKIVELCSERYGANSFIIDFHFGFANTSSRFFPGPDHAKNGQVWTKAYGWDTFPHVFERDQK